MHVLNPLLTGFVAKGSRGHSGPKLNNPCLVNGKYCSSGEEIISHVMCALKHIPKGRPSSNDKNVAAPRGDERKPT
jgi:hypothetical protein